MKFILALRPASEDFHLLRRLFTDLAGECARFYFLAFCCMGVGAATTALSAWIMRDIVNKIFVAKELSAVWAIGISIAVIYMVKGLASYGQDTLLASTANRIVANVQTRIFDQMLAMKVAYYDANHSTAFIAQQAFISRSASDTLNLVVTAFARDCLTLIGLLAVMFAQDWVMSLVSLTLMPAALFGLRSLTIHVRRVAQTEFASFASILESLQETAQGIRTIKSFTLEPVLRKRQQDAIVQFQAAGNKLARANARSSPLMETLGGLTIAAVVTYGGVRVILDGQDPGNFFAFITALLLAYEPAKRLARLKLNLTASLVGVRLLYNFIDHSDLETPASKKPDLSVRAGRIDFRGVDFAYRPNEPVLRGLTLALEPGCVTALVGPSGGGKSTIMSLLLGYYAPAQGCVEIDGADVSRIDLGSLRRSIAYVSQDCFLFRGSIRENIAFGKPGATEAEIVAAAQAAYADEFINKFESGYDTYCGEHGQQLSGGQRQRIALARAFLKDAPIILFDEATSALDATSERFVQQALATLCAGRTTLVIAHRLGTIQNADKICVISDGRLVEAGSHHELMSNGGIYRDMHGQLLHSEDA
jgi:subfamily B ATP-binding cassette protein MsbA